MQGGAGNKDDDIETEDGGTRESALLRSSQVFWECRVIKISKLLWTQLLSNFCRSMVSRKAKASAKK